MNAIVSGAVGRILSFTPFDRRRIPGGYVIVIFTVLSVLFGPFLSSCAEPAADSPETEAVPEAREVADVARDFLAALSRTDTATLRSLMAPGLSLSSVRSGPEGAVIRHSTGEDFLGGLGGEDQTLLERMWDPVVHVHDQVAVVWTPYDFFLNGEFSHCGIDVFTMLRGEDGWRVIGITYDVVREGCPPSPLGPPAGE
jgi:hypothetical protein